MPMMLLANRVGRRDGRRRYVEAGNSRDINCGAIAEVACRVTLMLPQHIRLHCPISKQQTI